MNTLKHIGLNVLVVCFGLILALGVLELGVRVLGLHDPPSANFVEPHPQLGWSHVPGKAGYWHIGEKRIPIKINSKGLRDKEYPYEKEDGVFRILVLGDSFTEAFQVPLRDTFCKVLEHKLNRGNGNFEVINGGLAGVGTDYALLFLKREGFKYEPDLLLLAFFPNDIVENYKSKQILDDTGSQQGLYYDQQGLVVRIKQFLSDHSHAFNYFGTLAIKHFPGFTEILVDVGLLGAVPVQEGHKGVHLHHLVLEKTYSPEMEQAWDVTEYILERLAEEASSRGCRLAVVSIPFREQVYTTLWKSELARPEMKRRQWSLNKPDRLLSVSLAKMDIPMLQLLPKFKNSASDEALYYGVDDKVADGHWTPAGHRLAADLIHEWLIEEKLVPADS